MAMNGDTGFHHKAAKGKAVGGHFKRSVNTARSHLCRLSKQHISKTALKGGGGGGFLEKAQRFSQNTFDGANGALDAFPSQG